MWATALLVSSLGLAGVSAAPRIYTFPTTVTTVVTTVYTTKNTAVTSTLTIPTVIQTVTATATETETNYATVIYENLSCKKAMKCPKGTSYISPTKDCRLTHYPDGKTSSTCLADYCCTAKKPETLVVTTTCQGAKVKCSKYSYLLTDIKGNSVPCVKTYVKNKLVSTTCIKNNCCSKVVSSSNVPCTRVVKCSSYKRTSSGYIVKCSTKKGSQLCTVGRCCRKKYVVKPPPKPTTMKPSTKTVTKTQVATATVTQTYKPVYPTVVYEKTSCEDAMKCPSGTEYVSGGNKKCVITYLNDKLTTSTCTAENCCTAKKPDVVSKVTTCGSAGVSCPVYSYLLTDAKGQTIPCVKTYQSDKLVETTCIADNCCTQPKPNRVVPCPEIIKCEAYKISTVTGKIETCRTRPNTINSCDNAYCCTKAVPSTLPQPINTFQPIRPLATTKPTSN